MNDDLAFTSSINLLELIATKEISPVEITQLYLNRIEKLDSHLKKKPLLIFFLIMYLLIYSCYFPLE